jgi:hypothetical protein
VLPTPPLAEIASAYADAYELRYFHQRPLVSQTTFTSLARERGIALKSSRRELEALDKAGALRALLRLVSPRHAEQATAGWRQITNASS